jgi:hypothetical protein
VLPAFVLATVARWPTGIDSPPRAAMRVASLSSSTISPCADISGALRNLRDSLNEWRQICSSLPAVVVAYTNDFELQAAVKVPPQKLGDQRITQEEQLVDRGRSRRNVAGDKSTSPDWSERRDRAWPAVRDALYQSP